MSGTTKLMTPGGGGVNLTPASSIASDVTVSLPSITGTALVANSTGVISGSAGNNVGLGYQSLNSNTASNNTAVGYQAGYTNTTGTRNTFLGYSAGYSNSTNSTCTYVGAYAGYNTTGTSNTFVGDGSGNLVTTGAYNTILGGFSGNQNSLDIRTADNYIVLSDGVGNPNFYINDTGDTFIKNTSFGAPNGGFSFAFNSGLSFGVIGHASGSPNTQAYLGFNYAGTAIGNITQNGTTGVLYNTSSDYRLKENVTPIANGIDAIKALNPVTFDWKSDGSEDSGFIAHEFQSVIPRSVTGDKDATDSDGNPVYQAMDSKGAIPFLVAAIKELSAKNDALEARLSALEAK